MHIYIHTKSSCATGWRRVIGCLKLQVIFRKRATMYRALSRKMTYRDKASYDSTPPCSSHAHPPPMSHIWMNHVAHTNKSHVWVSHVARFNESWHTYMNEYTYTPTPLCIYMHTLTSHASSLAHRAPHHPFARRTNTHRVIYHLSHANTHTHTHTHSRKPTHKHTHTHTNTHTHTHTNTSPHTHTHSRKHTYKHTHTHTNTHTHTHKYVTCLTQTHTHTHTHTHVSHSS